ncbi:MAG: hypothetical protein MJ097_04595 [Dorea sp.]|nr:hypothetical protein [Dorea sp.]
MGLTMKLSKTSVMHYEKLVFRSALFLWALFTYIFNEPLRHMDFSSMAKSYQILLVIVWIVFMTEMIIRLTPTDIESTGFNKQFAQRFKPSKTFLELVDKSSLRKEVFLTKNVLIAYASWIGLNGFIYLLYYYKIITDGILLIIALFYSMSDMICILFFCPFQSWMLKNRCCATCRIYDWDYLMMFTPLIVIPSFFTWSLAGFGFFLYVRWEYKVWKYPERFIESCNDTLKCSNCDEKLCHHKKQLHRLWKHERERLKKLNDYKKEQLAQLTKIKDEQFKKLDALKQIPKDKLSSLEVKEIEKLVKVESQQLEKMKQLEEKIKKWVG